MPIEYKIDVLKKLKEAGFTTYKLRTDKLLPEATIQALRKKKLIGIQSLKTVCQLLHMQPGDILVYNEDQSDEPDQGLSE